MKLLPVYLFFSACILTLPLAAQPLNFEFAIGTGAAGQDLTADMVLDASGNAFVTGHFNNTVDFDPSMATANLSAVGSADIFIARYDADGNYVWAFSLGGSSFDNGVAITSDATGIYVTGYFTNTVDFDPGMAVTNLSSASGDGFIARYDFDGNFVWAGALQGAGTSTPRDLTIDGSGNLLLGGEFNNTVDFDPSAGTANLTAVSSYQDLFIAKYTSAGAYVWAQKLSGTGSKTFSAIDTDNSGNVYIAGYFNETVDFNPGAGTANLTGGTFAADGFVARYSSIGTYSWAGSIGNPAVNNFEGIQDMEVDGSGNIVVTGYFNGGNPSDFDLTAGTANLIASAGSGAFVARYTSTGGYLWAFGLGASGTSSRGQDLDLDNDGNIYVTGDFTNTVDFDPSGGSSTVTGNTTFDVFFARYSSSGVFDWADGFGGNMAERPTIITTNHSGSLWIGGLFSTTVDFDIDDLDVYDLTSLGSEDAFLARYEYCAATTVSELAHTDLSCFGANDGEIVLDAAGTAPFTFAWTPNISSGSIASNLAAGNYQCVVTSGCGNSDTFSIDITSPPAIVPAIVSQTNVNCFGESSGQVTVSATGGTGALTYEWQPGSIPGPSLTNVSAGTYTCTITDVNNCEVSQVIMITEPAALSSSQNIDLCYGESYTIGANTYSADGTYIDVLTSVSGCDSTVTTVLEIHDAIDNTVVQDGITLQAVETAAAYQWMDCQSNVELTGETGQTFTANTDGQYAVIIELDGCSDTSACYVVTGVGIDETNAAAAVYIYPNPADDLVHIRYDNGILEQWSLCDLQGRVVLGGSTLAESIRVDELPAGTYVLKLQTSDGLFNRVLVIR